MRIVISLGASPPSASATRRQDNGEPGDGVTRALAAIARSHQVVLVLGNSFPLGVIDAPGGILERCHLDAVHAESGAVAGHGLCLALANHLADRQLVTLVTQVVMGEDESAGPLAVVELAAIDRLLEAGVTVCVGAGVPVIVDGQGAIRCTMALVSEERTAALLGILLGADVLLLLGNGPLYSEAGRRFVEESGRRAAIGAPEEAERVLAGTAGTQLVPHGTPPTWYRTGDFPAERLSELWNASLSADRHDGGDGSTTTGHAA